MYAWINSLQYNVWSALEESEIRTYILLFAFHQGVIVAWNRLWPCVSSTYVWKNFLKYYWTRFKTSIKKKIRGDLVFGLNVCYLLWIVSPIKDIKFSIIWSWRCWQGVQWGILVVHVRKRHWKCKHKYFQQYSLKTPETIDIWKTVLKEKLWFDWIYEV